MFLIGLFSYEFLALAVGLSTVFVLNYRGLFLDFKWVFLGIGFLGAVVLWPGVTYEYLWLSIHIQLHLQNPDLWGILVLSARYVGLTGYGIYLYRKLKPAIAVM